MATKAASMINRAFSKANGKKIVVISGCDSGLGFSLANRCNANGFTVVAGCLLENSDGSRLLKNVGIQVAQLDITLQKSVDALVTTLTEYLKDENFKLQAVVNNAAVMVFGEFEWQSPRLMHEQVEVNLLGSFRLAHGFLPLLRKHQGRLVNIVSHCALAGLPGLSVYGATKAALLNWSDCMRVEQAKYGVKVVSVIPGSFFGESNIMVKQAQYAAEMLRDMPINVRDFHGDYFKTVQDYLSQLSSPQRPIQVTDEVLYRKLLHALTSPSPKAIYKHEPLRYKLYHTLFKLCPTPIRDRLVERFVMLPKYKTGNASIRYKLCRSNPS